MLKYQVTFATLLLAVSSLNLDPTINNEVTPGTQCTTRNNEPGVCVVYYLCNENGTVNSDGAGIIDIRVGESVCPSYLDTCCRPPNVRDVNDPITPRPETEPNLEGCGWRNPNGVGFISTGDTQGDFAKFGEFPWMVAVLKQVPISEENPESQHFNLYIGGGSLIHASAVLTAAHLVTEAHHYRARAGEWDTQTTKEIYPYQEREVEKVLVHEDYTKSNLRYDIAILFLSSPMQKAPNVGLACLPPLRYETPGGTPCLASGWGKNQFGKEGRYQVILKKVEISVVERSECQARLRLTRLGRYFRLHETFMCAGGDDGKDTCKGDGGSPLVCPIPNQTSRYMETGIVSWGIGCGQNGNPGVYSNVAILREWVDQNMIQRGYDPKAYTI